MGMLKNTNKKSPKWANSDRTLEDFRPEHMATIEDLEKTTKPKEVTFNTNLKITNHARNMLQSLMTLGYTSSQKDAIGLLYEAFRETLDNDSKKELDMQYKTLEKRDARLKNKK